MACPGCRSNRTLLGPVAQGTAQNGLLPACLFLQQEAAAWDLDESQFIVLTQVMSACLLQQEELPWDMQPGASL